MSKDVGESRRSSVRVRLKRHISCAASVFPHLHGTNESVHPSCWPLRSRRRLRLLSNFVRDLPDPRLEAFKVLQHHALAQIPAVTWQRGIGASERARTHPISELVMPRRAFLRFLKVGIVRVILECRRWSVVRRSFFHRDQLGESARLGLFLHIGANPPPRYVLSVEYVSKRA
jgi:hypothetical protein